jgi:hypothetical protein
MGVLFEINRDFPFQVALSFDDAAMEVLEWLDEAPFEWDMYVDLPENCIRYCFRVAVDAMAFKLQVASDLQRRAAGGER